MQKYQEQLHICRELIERRLAVGYCMFMDDVSDLYAAVQALTVLLPTDLAMYKTRLESHILPNLRLAKPTIMGYGQPTYTLSPVPFGELVATIAYLLKSSETAYCGIDWNIIHPAIARVAHERFEVEQYADAVEAAFKTINVYVKTIVKDKTGEELDGVALMQKAFNKDNPIIPLNDLETRTEKDIQQGCQFMFAGAMSGIRNPQAHGVENVSREDAIRKLHFASMLMYKLDGRQVK